MKLGIMSDTHGNVDYMRRAALRMSEEFHVDRIIHLGDDLADARQMGEVGAPLTAVPGVFESDYQDAQIPHRFIEEIEGVRFLISHTPTVDSHDLPGDLDPQRVMEDGQADILLHGHTHIYKIEELKRGLAINPGHLKLIDKKGCPPSFATIDIGEKKEIRVQIIEIDGGLLDEKTFKL